MDYKEKMTIPELYENLKKEIDKLTYHSDHESCSKCHHCIACEQNNIARAKLSIMKEILQEEVGRINEIECRNTYCKKCKKEFDEDMDECAWCDGKNIEHRDLDITREELLSPLNDILKDMNSEGNEK